MIRQLHLGTTIPAAILLLMVVWAPIPFGGVLPFDRALLQVAAFAAVGLIFAAGFRGAVDAVAPTLVPSLMLGGVGVFGLLQSLAWPRAVAAALSPASAATWAGALQILEPGSEPAGMVPLSLAPAVSRVTAIQWLAVAAALLAATAIGRHRRPRRLLGGAIVLSALFQVLYGADRWFASADTIWGVQVPGDVGRLRGTFVNPDHLALYLCMAVGVVTAGLWWAVRRQGFELELERRLLFAAPPTMLFVTLFTGLAFTGSRAGLVAAVLGLLAQAVFLARHYQSGRILAYAIGALGIGFAAIALFGLQAGFGRWLDTSAYDLTWNSRLVSYRTTFDLWQMFPILGTGLGTFRQALPLAQGNDLQGSWIHAHSDYLELLATTGMIGLPLLIYGAVRLVLRLIQVLRDGRRSEDRGAALAALGAVVVAAAISAIDFGLTTPANAYTLAIICGLACGAPIGASRSRSNSRSKESADRRSGRSSDRRQPSVAERVRASPG